MAKKKTPETRINELMSMLIEMGVALVEEGSTEKNYTITQSGNLLIFISSLLLDEKDVYDFSELCSMFSSKKLLDNIIKEANLDDSKKTINYDDFLKKLNQISIKKKPGKK